MRSQVMLLVLLIILTACGQDHLRSADEIEQGETLLSLDFETPDAFETGDHTDASLTLENGQYVIRQSGERSAYIWGQGGEAHQDVSMEVKTQPQSDYANNLYGVMCRVDANGAGYAFLVSSDGFGAIVRTDGRSLAFLVDWVESASIKKGTADNTLRGVCVENYLALYVNDEWVADVEDDTYSAAGQVGLLAGLVVETPAEVQEVVVAFDDLTVHAVALK